MREVSGRDLTGLLRITYGKAIKAIFFESGAPVYAISNLPDEQPEQWMLDTGLATEEQIESAKRANPNSQQLPRTLIQLQVLTDQAMQACLRDLAFKIILSMFDCAEGEYAFTPKLIAKHEAKLDCTIIDCITSGARLAANHPNVLDSVAPASLIVIARTHSGTAAQAAKLNSTEGYVLSCLTSPTPTGEVSALTGLSDVETRKAVYVLLQLGLLKASRPGEVIVNVEPSGPLISPSGRLKLPYQQRTSSPLDQGPQSQSGSLSKPAASSSGSLPDQAKQSAGVPPLQPSTPTSARNLGNPASDSGARQKAEQSARIPQSQAPPPSSAANVVNAPVDSNPKPARPAIASDPAAKATRPEATTPPPAATAAKNQAPVNAAPSGDLNLLDELEDIDPWKVESSGKTSHQSKESSRIDTDGGKAPRTEVVAAQPVPAAQTQQVPVARQAETPVNGDVHLKSATPASSIPASSSGENEWIEEIDLEDDLRMLEGLGGDNGASKAKLPTASALKAEPVSAAKPSGETRTAEPPRQSAPVITQPAREQVPSEPRKTEQPVQGGRVVRGSDEQAAGRSPLDLPLKATVEPDRKPAQPQVRPAEIPVKGPGKADQSTISNTRSADRVVNQPRPPSPSSTADIASVTSPRVERPRPTPDLTSPRVERPRPTPDLTSPKVERPRTTPDISGPRVERPSTTADISSLRAEPPSTTPDAGPALREAANPRVVPPVARTSAEPLRTTRPTAPVPTETVRRNETSPNLRASASDPSARSTRRMEEDPSRPHGGSTSRIETAIPASQFSDFPSPATAGSEISFSDLGSDENLYRDSVTSNANGSFGHERSDISFEDIGPIGSGYDEQFRGNGASSRTSSPEDFFRESAGIQAPLNTSSESASNETGSSDTGYGDLRSSGGKKLEFQDEGDFFRESTRIQDSRDSWTQPRTEEPARRPFRGDSGVFEQRPGEGGRAGGSQEHSRQTDAFYREPSRERSRTWPTNQPPLESPARTPGQPSIEPQARTSVPPHIEPQALNSSQPLIEPQARTSVPPHIESQARTQYQPPSGYTSGPITDSRVEQRGTESVYPRSSPDTGRFDIGRNVTRTYHDPRREVRVGDSSRLSQQRAEPEELFTPQPEAVMDFGPMLDDAVHEVTIKLNRISAAADYYGVLGLTKIASNGSIQKAYESMNEKFGTYRARWPDEPELVSKVDKLLAKIDEAFATLGSPEKRRIYDMPGSSQTPNMVVERGGSENLRGSSTRPPAPRPVIPPIPTPVAPPIPRPVTPPITRPVIPPIQNPIPPPTARPTAPPAQPSMTPPAPKSVIPPIPTHLSPPAGRSEPAFAPRPMESSPAQPPVGPSSNPYESADQLFRQGRTYYERNDFHTAAHMLRQAVQLDPNRASYHYHLALTLSILSQARQIHQHHEGCHVTCNLGGGLTRNQRVRHEAEQHFLRASELDPSNAEFKVRLGLLYKEAGIPKKAEQYFHEALLLDAGNETARIELGLQEDTGGQKSPRGKLKDLLKG